MRLPRPTSSPCSSATHLTSWHWGDSLTAGYGLERSAAFPAQLQALMRQRWPTAIVENAGVSGDTTESGLKRLPRVLATLETKPDLAIVEFGANDLLRGIPPQLMRASLDAMLRELGRCGIPSLLATFEAPRFLGALGARYDGIYAEVAARHGATTAPFFPACIFGHPDMVLADRLHPNARAIERVAVAFRPAVLAMLDSHRAKVA